MGRALAVLLAALTLCACAQPGALTDGSREDVAALQRHVERRAAPLLAPGERLAARIIDLDRAGMLEPLGPGRGQVRVVRDVYPARIALSFRLTGTGGAILKQGERTLSAPLPVAAAAPYGEDPLRYERALLDGWLERELGTRGSPSGR